ncbi:MAG: fumarylacetoacetate hydrolase family protein [Balneolaceae bacterium]|nr:fumarylacetoacetate hydrolase family protein [Balneolaceae bacterium]
MKLIRFGNPGAEKPGVIINEKTKVDVSEFTNDFDPEFFSSGGLEKLGKWLGSNADSAPKVADTVRLGPPVANTGKIVCVGLNYADHAKEGGMDIPAEPILFFKATSAIVGPNDDMVIPKNSKKSDWEVELAVVIGKKASYVSEKEAMDYVAGYCVHNDYSEREFQLERGGQWVKGKSCDTFAPIGPFVVTKDEVKDVDNLRLWLKVNGEMKQDGSTADFIFKVPFLVSYISQFMTLHPGDIISTGTPAGVGLGFSPPQYLKPGDEVELGIDGLGVSKQTVRAYEG